MAQVLGVLPTVWETQMEFLAPVPPGPPLVAVDICPHCQSFKEIQTTPGFPGSQSRVFFESYGMRAGPPGVGVVRGERLPVTFWSDLPAFTWIFLLV